MKELLCRRTLACLALSLIMHSPQTASPVAAADESDKGGTEKGGTVAVFTLGKPLTEKPQGEELLFLTGEAPDSFFSLTKRMRQTKTDDEVKAVVLLMTSGSIGLAQAEELHRVIQEIKEAGKPVYAHADQLTTRQMMVLSGASRISVSPTGFLMMTGLYGEQLYLRGLLEKVQVQPDFITMGDYKSAAETFTRKSPSPEAETMYDWLFDGLFDATVQAIADGRGVKGQKVKNWIDRGIYSATEAAETGIIDQAQHRQDVVAAIKNEVGEGIKFDKRYGKKSGQQIDFSNPFAALQLWAKLLTGPGGTKSTEDAIAIVHVEGSIQPGTPKPSLFTGTSGAYSTPIRKALDEAAEDDSGKAVVLRVNSPGGSVVASEVILNAVRRVKSKKPIVVSMGNLAASGGYYVSCGAETIFAEPGTITGSIGVLAGKLVTTDMWNSVGIRFHPHSRGEKAGMLSTYAPFTDNERVRLTAWMEDVYKTFKGHVTGIRGDRLKKPVEELAGGRVFTGKQAHQQGLVDRLGGLNDALEFVAKEAGVEDYEVRVLPRPKTLAEMLMGDLGGQDKDSDRLSLRSSLIRSPLNSPMSKSSLWETALPMLQGLDPHRVNAVRLALEQLEIVRREQVSLTMPILVTE